MSRMGAAPGPSRWRNPHVRCLMDAGGAGRRALKLWCELWVAGAAGPAAEVWRGALIAAPAKPDGGVRPICLQESLVKLAANVLAQLHQSDLRRAAGNHQLGVGEQARADVAAMLLAGALREDDTEAMTSLDVANAFGTLQHWAIFAALTDYAPFLLPLLTDLWQTSGLRVWQRDGAEWHSRYATCGIPQGDPLAAWIYCITQRWLLDKSPSPPAPPHSNGSTIARSP